MNPTSTPYIPGTPLTPAQQVANTVNAPGYIPPVGQNQNIPVVNPNQQGVGTGNFGAPKPTTAVSSNTASDFITGTATNTANQGNAAIGSQNLKLANAGKPGFDINGNPIPNYTPPPAPTPTPTPKSNASTNNEPDINNLPPDPGNLYIYDVNGNAHQWKIGDAIPTGYTTTNPKTGPTANVTDVQSLSGGAQIKQFADGSYGKYDSAGNYIGLSTQQDYTTAKAGNDIKNSLAQALNGSYPLTSSQQSQITALQGEYQRIIDIQTTANANFTGGVTVAENLYGMGNNLVGLGEIKSSVDAGIAKITDIQNQMTDAVIKMTSGFDKDNLDLIKTAYDAYTGAADKLQASIDQMHKDAIAAENKAQDDAYKAAQDLIQNTLESDKLTWQEKQDTITNALNQAKLDEDKRHNLKTEAATAVSQQTDNLISNLPTVNTKTDGTIDTESQTNFLSSLPGGVNGEMATLVKAIANYQVNPNVSPQKNYKGQTGQLTQSQLVTLATQYSGGTYSQQDYNSIQKTKNDYASKNKGSVGGNINSLNTTIEHANVALNAFNKLGNGDITKLNSFKNWAGLQVGAGGPTAVITAINAVAGELATTYKGSAGTDVEIDNASKGIPLNSSPAQVKAFIETTMNLLGGRLTSLQEAYTQPSGLPIPGGPSTRLTNSAMSVLQNLKNNGYNIDVPGVNYTDVSSYLKYGGGSQANLGSARSALQTAGLPVTPENILQAAQEMNQ